MIDDVVGQTGVDLLEGDTTFEAGECRTQAEVGAVAEAEVPVGSARDVEDFGGLAELALVVVRSTDEQKHRVACPHRLTVTLDVGGQGAVHVLRRVVEPEHLLDGGHHAFGRGGEQCLLIGMPGEKFDSVRHHLGRGLVPGDHE